MKYTITTSLLFFSLFSYSQVGINVKTPLTDLHVNGTIQLVKDLKVGGTDKILGDSGKEGQFLKSNGEGASLEWVDINIPIVESGNYTQTISKVIVDKVGIKLTKGSTKRKYVENELITNTSSNDPNAKWNVINGLTNKVSIKKADNKLNIILQTMGHITESGFTFGLGVFINDQLKVVKAFRVMGTGQSFEVITLIGTIENLPIGTHEIKIAAIPRQQTGATTIGIGQPNGTNLSQFMANTSMQVDVFEKAE